MNLITAGQEFRAEQTEKGCFLPDEDILPQSPCGGQFHSLPGLYLSPCMQTRNMHMSGSSEHTWKWHEQIHLEEKISKSDHRLHIKNLLRLNLPAAVLTDTT